MPPVYSGNIVTVTPSSIQEGMPIAVTVAFKAATTSLVEKINGWWTGVEFNLISGGNNIKQTLDGSIAFGASVSKSVAAYMGIMPGSDVTGTVRLLGYKGGFSMYYEVLDVWTIRIVSSKISVPVPTPIENPTPLPTPEPEPSPAPAPTDSKPFPWWVVAAGAAVILLLPEGKGR